MSTHDQGEEKSTATFGFLCGGAPIPNAPGYGIKYGYPLISLMAQAHEQYVTELHAARNARKH
ncbi:MAG: hypothetical protein ACHREM_12200 [Polyangiales bacterium]